MSKMKNQDEENDTTCDVFQKKYPGYVECYKHSRVTGGEEKSKFTLINNNRKKICVAQIDKGVLPEKEGERVCDDLMIVCEKEKEIAYFIEYKGKDALQDAFEQIYDTLNRLKDDIRLFKQVNGRIVLTRLRAPNIKTSQYKQLATKLKQIAKAKGDNRKIEDILKYGKTPMEETIA